MIRPTLSLRSLPRSAPELVRTALLSQGPLTTHGLHMALHALSTPLPARPPPTNFLSGVARRLRAHELGIPPSSSVHKRFAGETESGEGEWSMSYLKKRVLKGMEERGEVVKVTRKRWAKMRGEGEGKEKGKEDEHVWAVTSVWEEMSRERVRPERVQEDEGDMRKEYGLREQA